MSDETSKEIYRYILNSAKKRIQRGESAEEENEDRKLISKCLRKLYIKEKKC